MSFNNDYSSNIKFMGFQGGCYSNYGFLGVYVLYEHIKQCKNQGDHHLRSIVTFCCTNHCNQLSEVTTFTL